MHVQTAADVDINQNACITITKKNPDWKKVMKINERWKEVKEESNQNIWGKKGTPEPLNPVPSDGRTFWRYQGERKLLSVQLSFRRIRGDLPVLTQGYEKV